MAGAVLWFTGLSGSGKSTLASGVVARVRKHGPAEMLDGDELRRDLSPDLGFSRADRDGNVRRIGFLARLLARHGVFVAVAAISPYEEVREEMRRLAEREDIPFALVFLDPSLNALIDRDPKGLYRRALAGEIPHFTGVSDPYERPAHADIVLSTDQETAQESIDHVIEMLVGRGLAPRAVLR